MKRNSTDVGFADLQHLTSGKLHFTFSQKETTVELHVCSDENKLNRRRFWWSCVTRWLEMGRCLDGNSEAALMALMLLANRILSFAYFIPTLCSNFVTSYLQFLFLCSFSLLFLFVHRPHQSFFMKFRLKAVFVLLLWPSSSSVLGVVTVPRVGQEK